MFGRHIAADRLVSGAYKSEYGDAEEIDAVRKRVEVNLVKMIFFPRGVKYSNYSGKLE